VNARAQAAVALLSGGLDSGVAAAVFRAAGGELAQCLTFDYGQRAAVREQERASRLAARLGVPWRAITLPWLQEFAVLAGSALLPGTGALPRGTRQVPGDAGSAKAVWVPARNAVFVAIAAAAAEAMGAGIVLAGFNREEAATFPDNSAGFVAAADAYLAFGTRTQVQVQSPTLGWDKVEIVQHARRLGFAPADFWSCYEGGSRPCGSCESCLRSAVAWGG
jgi:7-cyano-7-deazaguanine synthase